MYKSQKARMHSVSAVISTLFFFAHMLTAPQAGIHLSLRLLLRVQVILTRELAKGMVARNRGHIINVSSIAGHTPYPGGARACARSVWQAQLL